MITVPKGISDDIRRLLPKIDVSKEHRYVPCRPIPGAPQSECFPLVDARVGSEGGRRVLGWQIWQGQLLVEAEFHAVWESPAGELLDITPKPMAFSEILFVPDPNAIYEGRQVNNIRINITENSLVDDFIAVHEAVFRIENKGERAFLRTLSLVGREAKACRILNEAKPVLEWMAIHGHTRNSPCPCSSGMKYRVCHGKEIRELVKSS